MGIFRRFNAVVRSNLNALLDRAEDPAKLIAQTVSDMEEELKRARRDLVGTLGAAKRLQKKAIELDEEAARWEEKAALALREGDEELAREALRRKARTKKQSEESRRQAAAQEAAADEMKRTLERIERKVEDLKARKSSLASDVRRSRESLSIEPTRPMRPASFEELDRMSGRIDQLEAEVEVARALGDSDRAELDARLGALDRDVENDAVEDELSALKRKLEG